MTYSIFGHGEEFTMEQAKRADRVIKSGLLEHVYDDENGPVFSFHDLKLEDVAAARALMTEYGMTVSPELYEEHTTGCYCELVEVTDPDTLNTATATAETVFMIAESMKRSDTMPHPKSRLHF